jgi:hypothetical protein
MSKHVFPLLLDGAAQTVSSTPATWNTLTSFINVTIGTNTTVKLPIVDANGGGIKPGSLLRVSWSASSITNGHAVTITNHSDQTIKTLDTAGESATAVFDGTKWVFIAEDSSNGNLSATNLAVTGTLSASGAVTLSNNLTVSGTTTLNGNTTIGNAATDTVGFFGVSQPVAQPAAATQAAVTTAGSATYSQAEMAAVITLLNKLRADLVALGLIKGSAA